MREKYNIHLFLKNLKTKIQSDIMREKYIIHLLFKNLKKKIHRMNLTKLLGNNFSIAMQSFKPCV